MRLSVEILDHIFSFLVSHKDTLVACSTDPVLSPIVERHLYYHLIVNIGDGSVERTEPNYGFEPDRISELISAKPRILHYVRTLEIKFEVDPNNQRDDGSVERLLDEFAAILVKFPTLDCIMLKATDRHKWDWPGGFRDALKDRFQLPTVKSVHFDDSSDLLLPLLENCENIVNLSLLGYTLNTRGYINASTFPQLKSLTLIAPLIPSKSTTMAWIRLHIKNLHSLKCALVSLKEISELLDACPGTLHTLAINLAGFYRKYAYGELELSHGPPNLQRLTIRTSIILEGDQDNMPEWCLSALPAASEVINILASSLRNLILDITISLPKIFTTLANIDFSPLSILGSLSVPHIDLYIHTGTLSSATTRAQLLSSLEAYEDVTRSIKKGIIVVHSEEPAPDFV